MSVEESAGLLREWTDRLGALASQVVAWTKTQPGWKVERTPKAITEKALGSYTVDLLTIEDEQERRLQLEPIARRVMGADGIVELYAWPTLNRVRLLPNPASGGWDVLTDSGIKLHQPWNLENFITLARDLMAA
jgi:hypothetical protein